MFIEITAGSPAQHHDHIGIILKNSPANYLKSEAAIESSTERRRVKRFLFRDNADITATLSMRDQKDTVVKSEILNMSEDGLGFSFKINPNPSLKIGDRFFIKEIKGLNSADFLIDVEMEIKWILRYNPQRGARSGCEFFRKSEVLKEKIRRFIDHQIAQNFDITEENL